MNVWGYGWWLSPSSGRDVCQHPSSRSRQQSCNSLLHNVMKLLDPHPLEGFFVWDPIQHIVILFRRPFRNAMGQSRLQSRSRACFSGRTPRTSASRASRDSSSGLRSTLMVIVGSPIWSPDQHVRHVLLRWGMGRKRRAQLIDRFKKPSSVQAC